LRRGHLSFFLSWVANTQSFTAVTNLIGKTHTLDQSVCEHPIDHIGPLEMLLIFKSIMTRDAPEIVTWDALLAMHHQVDTLNPGSTLAADHRPAY